MKGVSIKIVISANLLMIFGISLMHVNDLTQDQQDFLLKDIVGIISAKLTIEADDGDIVIEDNIIKESDIHLKKRIDLDENMQKFSVSELNIELINWEREYDRENADSIFNVFRAYMLTDVDNTDTTVQIPYQSTPPLGLSSMNDLVGKIFTYTDGKVSRQGTITTISTVGSGSDQKHQFTFTPIGYNSSSLYDYQVDLGNYLEINQLIGKIATLEYVLDGVSDKVTVFKGLVNAVPDLEAGQASLVIHDAFSKMLDSDLIANYAEVKEYQRSGSSTGTLSVDENNVSYYGDQTPIGEWEIEITVDNGSYYSFTVTYPNGDTKTGRTDQLWVSDANDYTYYSALQIGSSDWIGTFDVDDVIVISTHFKQATSDVHLANALNTVVYNCLGSDLANLTEIPITIIPLMIAMSPNAIFKKQISVMKAAASLCQHLNITMFPGSDGKIHFFLLQPSMEDDPPVLDYSEDLGKVDIEHLPAVAGVRVFYNYDWDTGEFQNNYTFPPDYKGKTVDLKLGLFTSESLAAFQAQFYFAMHEKGLRVISFEEKLNYSIAFDLSDLYRINSLNPLLENRLVMMYDIVKRRTKGITNNKAVDMEFMFGDYAFCDVSKCDDGKIVW